MESFKDSAEEIELSNLLSRFFESEAGSEYRRKRFNGELEDDPKLWQKLKELGLFESFASKDSGFNVKALGRAAYECGRALLPESLPEHLLAGPLLFGQLLSTRTQAKIGENEREQIAAGELIASCLSVDALNPAGEYEFVAGLNRAQLLVIADSKQLNLFDLRSNSTTEKLNTLDRTVSLYRVKLSSQKSIALSDNVTLPFKQILHALKACELAGVAAKATEMTLDYVKTRKQFSVPIASFQAVQHKLSDMKLASEAIKSTAFFAVWCAESSKQQLALAADSALLFALEKAPEVVESAIQLHGGIGFTWEFDLHLYLRRAKSIEALFSSEQLGERLLRAAI